MADTLRSVLRGGQQPDDANRSTTQVLPIILTLLPVGGILLVLAGTILAGTIIGLAVITPLFVIFSPVLVPAAMAIGLAVAGFLSAGALGVLGLSSLSWIVNGLRRAKEQVPEGLEQAKRRMGDVAGHVGQRTKDVGQGIQNKAQ